MTADSIRQAARRMAAINSAVVDDAMRDGTIRRVDLRQPRQAVEEELARRVNARIDAEPDAPDLRTAFALHQLYREQTRAFVAREQREAVERDARSESP